jgi:predicted transport protein
MFTDHTRDQIGKYRVGAIVDSMPDFIKEAEDKIVSEDLTKLADGAFAYSDGVNRYFPIHTPEHTWLSHAYFEKFANEIAEPLRSEIEDRIDDAYIAFELPLNNLVKIAAQEDSIDALHSLSIEMNNFIDHYKRLPIKQRREKAKEILSRAFALGKADGMHHLVKKYSGNNLNPDYPQAFAVRMKYFKHNAPERDTLLQMQNEVPNHLAERIAEALHAFDSKTGLDKHYDNEIMDPYYDLLSPGDIKESPLNFDGESILPSKLKGFNHSSLSDLLNDNLLSELQSDPEATLKNMHPQIRVIVLRRMNHA